MKLIIDGEKHPTTTNYIIEVKKVKKENQKGLVYKYSLRTADSFASKQISVEGFSLNDIFEMFELEGISNEDEIMLAKYIVKNKLDIQISERIGTDEIKIRLGNYMKYNHQDLVEAVKTYIAYIQEV